MKRRKLTDEDKSLWQSVAKSATPLHPVKRIKAETISKPKKSAQPRSEPSFMVPDFTLGQLNKNKPAPIKGPGPSLRTEIISEPLRMDKKTYGTMQRGKLAPEAKIDLHGMTQDQAHRALTQFVSNGYARGLRMVLVITGKGRKADQDSFFAPERGVIRQRVPVWLRMAPLATMVLQISEAHNRHGGGGAYYVYLAKNRSVR